MFSTITLLWSLSLVLLAAAALGLAKLFNRPAAQRLDGKLVFSAGAENASKLLMVILCLSVTAAVFAVIWRFAP